jgi:hypothetical protein
VGGLALLGLAGVALRGQVLSPSQVDNFAGHPRVVVISDIGNEQDDQMSFVRLLMYSNELDLEATIASTSTWQKAAAHPETMHALIHAYSEVRRNLLKHAAGWPESATLDARVFAGQPGYGMAATGTGKMSEGAKTILRAVDREDDRSVWVCIWGDANTLAQALQYERGGGDNRGCRRDGRGGHSLLPVPRAMNDATLLRQRQRAPAK